MISLPPAKGAASRLLLSLLGVILLSSCSHARKKEASGRTAFVGELGAGSVLTDETIEELKKIADDPNSQLAGVPGEEASLEETPPAASSSLPPSLAWANGPFDPRSIQPGDVFFEQAGAILHKAASLADLKPRGEWESLLRSAGTVTQRTVPMTLSMDELLEIRESLPPQVALPTRSVAFDFRTLTREIPASRIESLFREAIDSSAEGESAVSKRLRDVRDRIAAGEEFFVITSVTASPSLKATYPGAPVGQRDTELVLNAITALYPHLDQLSAEKTDGAIVLTRDPEIYWEFTASSLILDGEVLKIVDENEEPPASFFSPRRRR